MNEISAVLCPASVQHPRQSEASILPFDDGRLLLAWTDYYAGKPKDGHPARIMGKWSRDEGESWSPPFVLQENIGKLNVMSASLLRLPSGRVLFAFHKKDSQGKESPADLQAMMRWSDDECRTWSAPAPITKGQAYWCGTNDRLLRLSTGRLLWPVKRMLSSEPDALMTWISDDEGETWRQGAGLLLQQENKLFEEPALVELADGSVAMFIRTEIKANRYQFIHVARSTDGGDTWKMHSDGGPGATFSPCIAKRLPGSTDLMLIWNNHMMRTSLTAAISRDNGDTWKNLRLLEEEEDWPLSRSHTYPSLAFLKGNAHITYWESHKHPATANMFHLIYRRLPVAWFYEQRPRRVAAYDPARDLLSARSEYDGEGG